MAATLSAHVKIGNRTFLMRSDDDCLSHVGDTFEQPMCALFSRLIGRDDRCIDVGANLGFTSILFAQIAAAVTAFEPSPTTFEFLRANIRHSLLRNVELHNCGLGESDEDLELTFSAANRAGAFVSNRMHASSGHVVEKISIRNGDSVIGRKRVNFIKIDVEGFEKNVLIGLEGCLALNKPVVVLELNHWCLNAFQRTSIPDFLDFLLALFPLLYAVHGDGYLDLHDADQRYKAMYRHIVHFEFCNLVGAFERYQVDRFLGQAHPAQIAG